MTHIYNDLGIACKNGKATVKSSFKQIDHSQGLQINLEICKATFIETSIVIVMVLLMLFKTYSS